MVNLLRDGQVGEALVGYVLGLQPDVASSIWSTHCRIHFNMIRRETRVDERRGYGIRVSQNEFSEGII
jgi:hypothetical protein